MAAIPGRTSKIKRFYWREIMFLTFKRFAERAEAAGLDLEAAHSQDAVDLRAEVQREVIEQIKQLHARNPKYDFSELSQSEVLSKHEVAVVYLDASFAPKAQAKGVGIFDDGEIVSAEEFVARQFREENWEVLFCESRPFHVLFAVYMWLVIHDPNDSLREMRGFAAKIDHPEYSVTKGKPLWTLHPPDFGTRGYGERRAEAIHQHLDALPQDGGELLWLFDYWIDGSAVLRDYLHAHEPDDMARARRVVEILPPEVLIRILRYLVGNYWGRFTGWPDLLASRRHEFFFAEVKASRDKLSGDQKRWIADNATDLRLPFKLVKINRVTTAPG